MGAWQDDAIYVATATSLAEGHGYRHPEIPGEPFQAKYPVLYPALLSVLIRIAPEYPSNVPLLLAPTAIAAAALVVLSALYWRRCFAPDPLRWRLACILSALSPAIVSMVRFTMSDLVYAALALAALFQLDAADEIGEEEPSVRRGLMAGALLGAATLTRSIGLSVLAGAVAFLFWRRRWRDASAVAGIAALFIVPWHLWQLQAAAANGAALGDGSLAGLLLSELNYGIWAPVGAFETLRVVVQNAVRIVFGLPYFQFGLPSWIAADALGSFSWATIIVHVLGYSFLITLFAGFVVTVRQRLRALHLAAIAYAIVVLAYPGDPYRFLLPWAPFLIYFLLAGAGRAAHLAAGGSSLRSTRNERIAMGVLGSLLALLFVTEDLRTVSGGASDYHFRVTPQDWGDARDLEAKLRELTDPEDVVASGDFAALYLSTGRQGYYAWPIENPYELFYGPDRSYWNFFILGTETAADQVAERVRRMLPDAYRAAGVRWYVDNARPDVLTTAVRRLIAQRPQWFQPVYLTPQGMFRIYRVTLPPLPGPAGRST